MSHVVRCYSVSDSGVDGFEPEVFIHKSDAEDRAKALSRIVDAAIVESVVSSTHSALSDHIGKCMVYVGGRYVGIWDSADMSSEIRR